VKPIAISCFLETENPLAKFSKEWSEVKYLGCNTEKNSPILSERGKEGLYPASYYLLVLHNNRYW